MCVFQLRGWVEEENRTIEFSIGKTSTEGKAHMMCIEGSDGKLLAPSLPDLCLFLTNTCEYMCLDDWENNGLPVSNGAHVNTLCPSYL